MIWSGSAFFDWRLKGHLLNSLFGNFGNGIPPSGPIDHRYETRLLAYQALAGNPTACRCSDTLMMHNAMPVGEKHDRADVKHPEQ